MIRPFACQLLVACPSPSTRTLLTARVARVQRWWWGDPYQGYSPLAIARARPYASTVKAFWSAWPWLTLPKGLLLRRKETSSSRSPSVDSPRPEHPDRLEHREDAVEVVDGAHVEEPQRLHGPLELAVLPDEPGRGEVLDHLAALPRVAPPVGRLVRPLGEDELEAPRGPGLDPRVEAGEEGAEGEPGLVPEAVHDVLVDVVDHGPSRGGEEPGPRDQLRVVEVEQVGPGAPREAVGPERGRGHARQPVPRPRQGDEPDALPHLLGRPVADERDVVPASQADALPVEDPRVEAIVDAGEMAHARTGRGSRGHHRIIRTKGAGRQADIGGAARLISAGRSGPRWPLPSHPGPAPETGGRPRGVERGGASGGEAAAGPETG